MWKDWILSHYSLVQQQQLPLSATSAPSRPSPSAARSSVARCLSREVVHFELLLLRRSAASSCGADAAEPSNTKFGAESRTGVLTELQNKHRSFCSRLTTAHACHCLYVSTPRRDGSRPQATYLARSPSRVTRCRGPGKEVFRERWSQAARRLTNSDDFAEKCSWCDRRG